MERRNYRAGVEEEMNVNEIKEGKAKLEVYEADKVSKELTVFYNPVMKFNRDVSVGLLNAVSNKDMQIGSPLAGSGAREIRLLLELKKGKIKKICINDYSKEAVDSIKKNLSLNKVRVKKGFIEIYQKDANQFLLESTGFDYIDIDPFGSPNPFLDTSIKRISRDGVLAITATDTAPLAGTYPSVCERKYWAKPLRNEHQHELGLRILIRKVQLVGAQYEKAFIPLFSYFKDHYFRVFFRCIKSKEKCDELIKQHKYFLYCRKCNYFEISQSNQKDCCGQKMLLAGPLWEGDLFDKELTKKITKDSEDRFLKTINMEVEAEVVGFYDIHKICKTHAIAIPKTDDLMMNIRKNGFFAQKTHFSDYGIKSDMPLKDLLKLM